MRPGVSDVLVPIAWNYKTLSWNAVCGGCNECLYMLTLESGLEPTVGSVQHVCLKGGRG